MQRIASTTLAKKHVIKTIKGNMPNECHPVIPDAPGPLTFSADTTQQDTIGNETAKQPRRSGRKRSAPKYFVPELATRQSYINVQSGVDDAVGESAAKRVRRGMRGEKPVNTSSPLQHVEPASNITGTIVTKPNGSGTRPPPVVYDAMLVLVDIPCNHDKFIVLQVVERSAPQKGYVFYERWGRTGTAGQSLTLEFAPNQLEHALQKFEDVFLQKTGLLWQQAEDPPVHGKYRNVRKDFTVKRNGTSRSDALWQCWVDDGVDGKSTDWYDYDLNGSELVERLFQEHQNNTWLGQRIVQSGVYTYLVDLVTMTQTNIVHPNRTVRKIRRAELASAKDDGNNTKTESVAVNVDNKTFNLRIRKNIAMKRNVKPKHEVKPAPKAKVPKNEIVKQKNESKQKKEEGEIVSKQSTVQIPVDPEFPKATNHKVVGDWDATMNKTNIVGNNNNNKCYRIQLLKRNNGCYWVWTRWGRVGEVRSTQTMLLGPFFKQEKAEKAFENKFKDKAGIHWSERATREPAKGKYELLEMCYENGDCNAAENNSVESAESQLIPETKELVEMLFEENMYLDALKEFDIDVRRMPLGKLKTEQIEKGVDVLKEIEQKLKSKYAYIELQRLSSRFYTVLPHDFGRRRPPIINNMDQLQRCYDMCNVLRDMESATTMMSKAGETSATEPTELKSMAKVDKQYELLKADLRLLEEGSEELDVVRSAFEQTKGDSQTELVHVWRVERKGEGERFRSKLIDNHQLLWHGSHIGSISAILATGLRIMPHSGGRVGRGIYLASENGKSLGYTCPAVHKRIGCMFMAEAALGRSCEIQKNNFSLRAPPKGFHSVRACGRSAPSSSASIILDNVSVTVPVGCPVPQPDKKSSSFSQDEFLVYDEAQVRLRYVVSVRM